MCVCARRVGLGADEVVEAEAEVGAAARVAAAVMGAPASTAAAANL